MAETDWIEGLFQAIDAMDTDGFLSFLSDDAHFRFGNAPALMGKDAIREALDGFFASLKGLRHRIIRTWTHPDAVICQGEVTYTRMDASEVTIPFVNVLGMADDHIAEYLIYIDMAPLLAAGS